MTARTFLSLSLLVGCAEPDLNDLFGAVELTIADGAEAASDPFVARARDATRSLHVAMPGGDDLALAEALTDAWGRGVDVEVITDFDLRDSPAVQALLAAEVPVALADDGLSYFEFNLGDDVTFPSASTIMSSAWLVADRRTVLAGSTLGAGGSGARVIYDVRGEDLIDDLLGEHNQIFGGTDATSVTAFDGPAKSITDLRWRYGTAGSTDLELWFGPQERLTKRVIDAVYAARGDVKLLTDDFANEGLAKALQDKAERGFDVSVVVGPSFGDSNAVLSRLLEDAPDVEARQVTGVDVVPTVAIVNWAAQASGLRARTQVMVMTHDLYSAARLYRGSPVESDQLIDGVMWTLSTSSEPDAAMQQLLELWQDHYDRSEAL